MIFFKGAVIGLLAGFLSSLLGLGPGMVIISSLSVFFNFEMKDAVACGLVMVIPVTIFGAISHYFAHDVQPEWAWVFWILCGGFVGIMGGLFLRERISEKFLKLAFIILLCFILARFAGLISWQTTAELHPSIFSHIVLGFIACFMSAMTGVGGGVLIVSVYNGFFAVPMKACVLLGLAIMIFNSVVSSLLKWRTLKWQSYLWPVPVFSLPGSVLGASLYTVVSGTELRVLFMILLAFIIVRMSLSLYADVKK